MRWDLQVAGMAQIHRVLSPTSYQSQQEVGKIMHSFRGEGGGISTWRCCDLWGAIVMTTTRSVWAWLNAPHSSFHLDPRNTNTGCVNLRSLTCVTRGMKLGSTKHHTGCVNLHSLTCTSLDPRNTETGCINLHSLTCVVWQQDASVWSTKHRDCLLVELDMTTVISHVTLVVCTGKCKQECWVWREQGEREHTPQCKCPTSTLGALV